MAATSHDTKSHHQNRDGDKDASSIHTGPSTEEAANVALSDPAETHTVTECKVSGKSHCKLQQGAIFSGKILSFCCSECKTDGTYSPNDLLKHFQVAHKGTLPTYPCDLCNFVTNEFSSLQRHRIGHRDTLVTCEICNDGVQYSLLLLTRHFIISHSRNGLFRCKKCEFSTRDAGTFVQHIHHHNESIHKYGYGAAKREYLAKHVASAHGDEIDRTNKRKGEDNARISSSGLKLLLKKNPPAGGSRETQWMSKRNNLNLMDQNGLLGPVKLLEETEQFNRTVVVKKDISKWSKGPFKRETQCSYSTPPIPTQPKIQDNELSLGARIIDPSNSNGLTVLMVKNKIALPPNCTTKVMGFKVVDGKKHLVLKVIPTKPESEAKSDLSPIGGGTNKEKTDSSCTLGPGQSESVHVSEPGTNVALKKLAVPGRGTQSLQLDMNKTSTDKINVTTNYVADELVTNSLGSDCDAITTNKDAPSSNNQNSNPDPEKNPIVSDHELSLCHLTTDEQQSSSSNANFFEIQEVPSNNMTDVFSELVGKESSMDEISSDHKRDEATTLTVDSNVGAKAFEQNLNVASLNSADEVTEEKYSVKPPLSKDTPSPVLKSSSEKSLKPNSHTDISLSSKYSPSKKLPTNKAAKFRPLETRHVKVTISSFENKTKESDAKNGTKPIATILHTSPNQEVFSFHNYSKENFGNLNELLEADENSPESLEEDEYEDESDELKLSSDWSLTLPASPVLAEQSEEALKNKQNDYAGSNDEGSVKEEKSLEQVSDSDIEVDECIATIDELSASVLPETEKQMCPLESATQDMDEKANETLSNAAVLGKILEEHSDAIISQQLEKERMVSSATTLDNNKPAKTTLRILHTPEGKQQMFLHTKDNPYAVPIHVHNGPGFKLITKTCASQVNVSYMQPGIKRPCKGTGLSFTLNGGRIGMSAQGLSRENKGQTKVLQAVSNSGGRYVVNASALKGPVLLSGAVKSPSGEQTNKKPTCYIVQRPSPVAPIGAETADSTSKTVLTNQPVLAVPVNSTEKAIPFQPGHQAYLVRYISPAKSGILVNSSSETGENQSSQASEGGKSRVFLKVVRNSNGTRFLSPCNPGSKPLYVAANSQQSPYLFLSSNNSLSNLSTGLKCSSGSQGSTFKIISAKLEDILHQSDINNKNQADSNLVMQTSRSMTTNNSSQTLLKKKRRSLFEDSSELPFKTRRILRKTFDDSDVVLHQEPMAKWVERTLRLSPFSTFQQIKYPRQNQPVVVLNHPDAEISEVTNIMKSVNRYKSEVVKVALSQNTMKALSEETLMGATDKPPMQNAPCDDNCSRPSSSNVRERFILKLKLKKKSRSKYEVVRLSSTTDPEQIPIFRCWFCGRLFENQEEWIGHGQRHLMEATRDWNKLF